MIKITQIAGGDFVFALLEDGTLWQLQDLVNHTWKQVLPPKRFVVNFGSKWGFVSRYNSQEEADAAMKRHKEYSPHDRVCFYEEK